MNGRALMWALAVVALIVVLGYAAAVLLGTPAGGSTT